MRVRSFQLLINCDPFIDASCQIQKGGRFAAVVVPTLLLQVRRYDIRPHVVFQTQQQNNCSQPISAFQKFRGG